jgi:hypothetical protein
MLNSDPVEAGDAGVVQRVLQSAAGGSAGSQKTNADTAEANTGARVQRGQ